MSVMALATLWASSLKKKNGFSTKTTTCFENRGRKMGKNGGRVQRELTGFLFVVVVVF